METKYAIYNSVYLSELTQREKQNRKKKKREREKKLIEIHRTSVSI